MLPTVSTGFGATGAMKVVCLHRLHIDEIDGIHDFVRPNWLAVMVAPFLFRLRLIHGVDVRELCTGRQDLRKNGSLSALATIFGALCSG